MPEPTEVQMAVAHALADTHPHHDHVIGAPDADGIVSVWLDGAGEFQDHRWRINADGRIIAGPTAGRPQPAIASGPNEPPPF